MYHLNEYWQSEANGKILSGAITDQIEILPQIFFVQVVITRCILVIEINIKK